MSEQSPFYLFCVLKGEYGYGNSVSTQSRPGFEAGSLLSGCFAICIVYFRRSKKTPRSTTNLLNDHEQLFLQTEPGQRSGQKPSSQV